MDPQGRVLLEQTGLALAHADVYTQAPTDPTTGVYVGVMHMEFIQHLAGDPLQLDKIILVVSAMPSHCLKEQQVQPHQSSRKH